MTTAIDQRSQVHHLEKALAIANDRLIEQTSEFEALEDANKKIVRRTGLIIQEVCAVSSVCSILTGFFVAWMQVYATIRINPGRALAAAGMALLSAWLGRRIQLNYKQIWH